MASLEGTLACFVDNNLVSIFGMEVTQNFINIQEYPNKCPNLKV